MSEVDHKALLTFEEITTVRIQCQCTKQFSFGFLLILLILMPGQTQPSDSGYRRGKRAYSRDVAPSLPEKLPPESSHQMSRVSERVLPVQSR